MEDLSINNAQKVKQPEPSFSETNGKSSKKRTYNSPHVGVLETPILSNMPILDSYVKKRKEHPQMKFKETFKINRFFDLQNTVSAAIVGLGGYSLWTVAKAAIKHFKK